MRHNATFQIKLKTLPPKNEPRKNDVLSYFLMIISYLGSYLTNFFKVCTCCTNITNFKINLMAFVQQLQFFMTPNDPILKMSHTKLTYDLGSIGQLSAGSVAVKPNKCA